MTRHVLPTPPPSSEITPEAVYLNRRAFLRAAGIAGAGALLAACGVKEQPAVSPAPGLSASSQADELGAPLTAFESVTNYNNYYEFTTDKEGVAGLAKDFPVRPWTVQVGGLVHKPATFAIDDLLTAIPQEERIYRLRCVEAWSMVIPWMGFELGRLLDLVEPMSSAGYVGFTTLLDPDQMPGQRSPFYPWPYTEGLRLDEAKHTLTLLSAGLYGQPLLPQNGAPLRLVVPMEVRLQEHQGHRAHRLARAAPGDHVEHDRTRGVRVLRQRQPRGRSPALVAGLRAPHRRGRPA